MLGSQLYGPSDHWTITCDRPFDIDEFSRLLDNRRTQARWGPRSGGGVSLSTLGAASTTLTWGQRRRLSCCGDSATRRFGSSCPMLVKLNVVQTRSQPNSQLPRQLLTTLQNLRMANCVQNLLPREMLRLQMCKCLRRMSRDSNTSARS